MHDSRRQALSWTVEPSCNVQPTLGESWECSCESMFPAVQSTSPPTTMTSIIMHELRYFTSLARCSPDVWVQVSRGEGVE